MKKLIQRLYYRINNRVLDYRYKVNKNAGLCFAYYLIMSIIPICSLFAFFASILNVDLGTLEQLLKNYLTPEFSNIIIASLKSSHITLSSIIIGIGMTKIPKDFPSSVVIPLLVSVIIAVRI